MEKIELKLGQEHAIHLPPLSSSGGEWTVEVGGMTSAVDVRKLWPADPYPEDDEEEEQAQPPPDVVFMVRAVAPGSATLRFVPKGPATGRPQPREVRIEIRI
jgi:hypothetical protein